MSHTSRTLAYYHPAASHRLLRFSTLVLASTMAALIAAVLAAWSATRGEAFDPDFAISLLAIAVQAVLLGGSILVTSRTAPRPPFLRATLVTIAALGMAATMAVAFRQLTFLAGASC
jgi:hypothetical protein